MIISNQNHQLDGQELMDQIQLLISASKEAIKTSSTKHTKQTNIQLLDLMQARDLNQLSHGQLLLILSDLTDIRKTVRTCMEKEQKLMNLSSRIGDLNHSLHDNSQRSSFNVYQRSPVKHYQPPPTIQSNSIAQSSRQPTNPQHTNIDDSAQVLQLKQQLERYQQHCKQLEQKQLDQDRITKQQLDELENQCKEIIAQKEVIISTLNCQMRNMEQKNLELQQVSELSQKQQQEYDQKISHLEHQIESLMAISQQQMSHSDNVKQLSNDLAKQQEHQQQREKEFVSQKNDLERKMQQLQNINNDLNIRNQQNELKLSELSQKLEHSQRNLVDQEIKYKTELQRHQKQNDELQALIQQQESQIKALQAQKQTNIFIQQTVEPQNSDQDKRKSMESQRGAFLTGIGTETPQSQQIQIREPAGKEAKPPESFTSQKYDVKSAENENNKQNVNDIVEKSYVDLAPVKKEESADFDGQNKSQEDQGNNIVNHTDADKIIPDEKSVEQQVENNINNENNDIINDKINNENEVNNIVDGTAQGDAYPQVDLEADFDDLDLDNYGIVKKSTDLNTAVQKTTPQNDTEEKQLAPIRDAPQRQSVQQKLAIQENDSFDDIDNLQVFKPNTNDQFDIESEGSQKEQPNNNNNLFNSIAPKQNEQKKPTAILNPVELEMDFDNLDIDYNPEPVANISEKKDIKQDDFDALLDPFGEKSKKKSKKKKKQTKPVQQTNALDLGDDDIDFSL